MSNSNSSLTRHKQTNKFRMHQDDKNTKDTKTIISFETILGSAMSTAGGTGTFSDMMTLTSVLKFCEDKLKANERLGFKEDLVSIRNSLGKIVYRASPGKEININNWNCPFVTIAEQIDIEKLVFLVEYQYTRAPVLDPDISLNDHYNRFVNESRK